MYVYQANLPISMDMSLDTFYQHSQFMFGGRQDLNQQTAPQTPQTPSSIPDIVLQGVLLISMLCNVYFLNGFLLFIFSRFF